MSVLPQLVPTLTQLVPGPALGAAYRAQQASIRLPLQAVHGLLRGLTARGPAPRREDVAALEREYGALLERDLRNAEQGLYPRDLLFQLPVLSYARRVPRLLLDLPRTWRRSQRRRWNDLPEVDRERFPSYFRRTFHWQTDGYLSEHSAGLYDVSVELLFLGCADVMRRQVIPPMTRFARQRGRLRILDVGCGTGRTLLQVAAALPGQQYVGVDLSPFYLEHARRLLERVPEATLMAENAEKLPFTDDYFDIVSSTFLFHELPRRVRRRVMGEMVRVLRPGGLLVVEDSAQLSEAPDLAFFLAAFSAQLHEPFYRDYVRDDLAALMEQFGLEVESTDRAWLSKVVAARAPVALRAAAGH